jgi:hypothetical protein
MNSLSEWIYMIADQQPSIDRNIYYDRAEEAKNMEDALKEIAGVLLDIGGNFRSDSAYFIIRSVLLKANVIGLEDL